MAPEVAPDSAELVVSVAPELASDSAEFALSVTPEVAPDSVDFVVSVAPDTADLVVSVAPDTVDFVVSVTPEVAPDMVDCVVSATPEVAPDTVDCVVSATPDTMDFVVSIAPDAVPLVPLPPVAAVPAPEIVPDAVEVPPDSADFVVSVTPEAAWSATSEVVTGAVGAPEVTLDVVAESALGVVGALVVEVVLVTGWTAAVTPESSPYALGQSAANPNPSTDRTAARRRSTKLQVGISMRPSAAIRPQVGPSGCSATTFGVPVSDEIRRPKPLDCLAFYANCDLLAATTVRLSPEAVLRQHRLVGQHRARRR
jgi:hypothetical protein